MPRRRRYDRHPPKDKQHPIQHPSDRDLRIFKRLDPFRACKFLTTSWIQHLEPATVVSKTGKGVYNSQRLGFLWQEPNYYLERDPDQLNTRNVDYKDSVYSLDDAAKRYLTRTEEYEWQPSYRSNSYAHELYVDLSYLAPMMAAAKEDPALAVYDIGYFWDGNCIEYKLPSGTVQRIELPANFKTRKRPFAVEIDGDHMTLDAMPRVLVRTIDGMKKIKCIAGTQHVRKAKAIARTDIESSSVGKHLRHLVAFYKQKKFRSWFGFPNCMTPLYFTNETNMLHATDYLASITEGSCPYALFKHVPDLAHELHFPKPGPDFFMSPFKRVGMPDFSFDAEGFR